MRYVIMDASFYKLNIFIRPSTQTFTDAAIARQTSNPSVRVITNGQYCNEYAYIRPGPIQWQGEIIVSHTVRRGVPSSYPNFYHYGQFDGLTDMSYDMARGNPSAVTRDRGYNAALGRLLPLINGGVLGTPVQLGSAWRDPPSVGKICLGIHRPSNTIFVFLEEDGHGTTTIPRLQSLLNGMGVDDAALADGSDSTALVVDRGIEVTPGSLYKNPSIPCGPEFSLIELSFNPTSSQFQLNATGTTNPAFLPPFFDGNPFYDSLIVRGFTGTVSILTTGYEFRISSFGGLPPPSLIGGEAADLLGVPLPLVLIAPVGNLTTPTNFVSSSSSPWVEANLRHVTSNSADKGRLEGVMLIRTSSGNVSLYVTLQIS